MFQLRWFYRNLKGGRGLYLVGIILTVIAAFLVLANPMLIQRVIDEVVVGVPDASGTIVHHTERLIPLLIGLVAFTLLRTAIRYVMIICYEQATQTLVFNVRTHLYDNLQKQEMNFFDKNATGDLMTRLTGDLDMVRHVGAWIVYNALESAIVFIACIIYLCTIHLGLTLALIAVAPVICVVTNIYSKKVRPKYVALRERLTILNQSAQENIAGNRVVKAFAREQYETERFAQKNREYRDANLDATFTWLRFQPVIEILAQLLTVVTILLGGLFIINGSLTAGELMAFSSITWALSNPMRLFGTILNDLQRFFASANKVVELYYTQPRIVTRHDAVRKKPDERLRGTVVFDHVSFAYGKETVLDDVTFTANPGQTIAIMGPTGSGKTTLLNLIARFYDVTEGKILVDGVDVRMWDLHDLRGAVGMTTQEVFLFSDTVDGNICYAEPDMPEEEVHQYAKFACADGFIQQMEDGYNTIVGERGVGLSGGQKQRIALARAQAAKPSVLILDDTTSAVDMETEKEIQQYIAQLPYDCTKLIVAQRISSVKDADQILILKDGKIAERGTHEELLAQNGYYREIYSLQHEAMKVGGDA